MSTFEQLISEGLDRKLPPLIDTLRLPSGPSFSVGDPGMKVLYDNMAERLDKPHWEWPRDPIPCGDGKARAIYAYHFMEHLTGDDNILFLYEVNRALMRGGVLQFCTPHWSTELAHHDLTHRSFWSEDTFRIFLDTTYYDTGRRDLSLKVHYVAIAGVVQRNLCIVGQLVKG